MNLNQYKREFHREYKKKELLKLTLFDSINTLHSDNSSNITYSLNENLFYYSKNVIEPSKIKELCEWSVEQNQYKMLYLSYKTLDNKFAISPEDSFIDIKSNEVYYIDISINKSDKLYITPMIIHYVNGTKTKLTKVVKKNQLLRFDNNENKCRLTFKIKGTGHFTIEHIKLLKLR